MKCPYLKPTDRQPVFGTLLIVMLGIEGVHWFNLAACKVWHVGVN